MTCGSPRRRRSSARARRSGTGSGVRAGPCAGGRERGGRRGPGRPGRWPRRARCRQRLAPHDPGPGVADLTGQAQVPAVAGKRSSMQNTGVRCPERGRRRRRGAVERQVADVVGLDVADGAAGSTRRDPRGPSTTSSSPALAARAHRHLELAHGALEASDECVRIVAGRGAQAEPAAAGVDVAGVGGAAEQPRDTSAATSAARRSARRPRRSWRRCRGAAAASASLIHTRASTPDTVDEHHRRRSAGGRGDRRPGGQRDARPPDRPTTSVSTSRAALGRPSRTRAPRSRPRTSLVDPLHRRRAQPAAHLEADRHPLGQLGHVADESDHPAGRAEVLDGPGHDVEGGGVERAEALVQEERLEWGGAAAGRQATCSASARASAREARKVSPPDSVCRGGPRRRCGGRRRRSRRSSRASEYASGKRRSSVLAVVQRSSQDLVEHPLLEPVGLEASASARWRPGPAGQPGPPPRPAVPAPPTHRPGRGGLAGLGSRIDQDVPVGAVDDARRRSPGHRAPRRSAAARRRSILRLDRVSISPTRPGVVAPCRSSFRPRGGSSPSAGADRARSARPAPRTPPARLSPRRRRGP